MKRLAIIVSAVLVPVLSVHLLLAAGFFKVGEKAPSFALNAISGEPVSLDAYKGKVVVLGLFHICDPCMTGTAPRDIDFRIKMPDQAGRRWLWEDKIEPSDDDSAASAPDQSDETAGFFRRDRQFTIPSSALPASAPSSGIGIDRRIVTVRLVSPPAGFAFS